MSWYSKVAWSQGMTVQPQHFQQDARYFENLIFSRCVGLLSYDWGLQSLRFDTELLNLGKVALEYCNGRFADGTPFSISQQESALATLDVPEIQNQMVYLALPLRRTGMVEVSELGIKEGLERFHAKEESVSDTVFNQHASEGVITTADLNLRLVLGNELLNDFTTIAVAKIVERQPDGKIVLDENYIPPSLNCDSNVRLKRFVEEIKNLISHRADELANRISDGGRGASSTSEIADFLLLQLLNRFHPVLSQFQNMPDLHPQQFHQSLIQLAGELTTFTKKSRRASDYPLYQHHGLQETFTPVLEELRHALVSVIESSATVLELQKKKFGIYVSPIADRNGVENSFYVIAAKASTPSEELRAHFANQTKVGPVEKIRDLVNFGLPGIAIRALSAPPRQIPYHSGFTYFELERGGELWQQMASSSGFAFHISSHFENLQLEFWAIKE